MSSSHSRRTRARRIAEHGSLMIDRLTEQEFTCKSQSSPNLVYSISIDDVAAKHTCTCPDYRNRQPLWCKHIYAVLQYMGYDVEEPAESSSSHQRRPRNRQGLRDRRNERFIREENSLFDERGRGGGSSSSRRRPHGRQRRRMVVRRYHLLDGSPNVGDAIDDLDISILGADLLDSLILDDPRSGSYQSGIRSRPDRLFDIDTHEYDAEGNVIPSVRRSDIEDLIESLPVRSFQSSVSSSTSTSPLHPDALDSESDIARDCAASTEKTCGKEDEEECPICCESLFCVEEVRILPCFHYIHTQCLRILLSSKTRVRKLCPICRRPLDDHENDMLL